MEKSDIWLLKSKFFSLRLLSYSFFLLFPIWIQKTLELPQWSHIILMILYILFLFAQWFLLGKEIDYRFKIYFKVNSSLDRVIYRILLGMIFFIVYYNLLSLLPVKWINNIFWGTWGILGIFYSWPTRGKIIKESVSSQFGEFNYLDSFEKTLLGMIVLLFVISIPEIPQFVNLDALKLFIDPNEVFHSHFWNFLYVNYIPFRKYPELLKIGWIMHFYIAGMGVFLLTLYGVFRFYVSRRLAILGVFSVISTWSYVKILAISYGTSILTTYSIILFWTYLWIIKSATYRTGLFLGLVVYYGVLLNINIIYLQVVFLLFLFFYSMRSSTLWHKKKLLRYSLLGFFLALFTVLISSNSISIPDLNMSKVLNQFSTYFFKKAFFSLSILGLIIMLFKIFAKDSSKMKEFNLDKLRVNQFLIIFCMVIGYSLVIDTKSFSGFSILWPMALLSLIPLELLFQSLSRYRSNRNIIYAVYILICLLDSHFEGRIKILLRLF